MTPLREAFIRELVLRGTAARTQESYVAGVYHLARQHAVTPQDASYEIQLQRLIGSRRTYPVRVTPIPAGTWCLQALSHEYRPYLFYWGMATVQDIRNPTGSSTWTLWFGFREPPMEHLDRLHQDGRVAFLAEDDGPHSHMVAGFTFDLFVGPGGTIARGQILEAHDRG